MPRLTLLPYLQSYDGSALAVRLLCLPDGDPTQPLTPGHHAFANAALGFEARLSAPDAWPAPGGGAPVAPTGVTAPDPAPLFERIATILPVDASIPAVDPRTLGRQIKKALPDSYRAAAQATSETHPLAVALDEYACVLRAPRQPKLAPPTEAGTLAWGQVIATALRQQLLAEALGLVRPMEIPLDPALAHSGGWLFVTLAAGADEGLAASADLRLYATRIPPLDGPRTLFSPVLFPVTATPAGGYDEAFLEVAEYADGFAKVVHGAQQRHGDSLASAPDGRRPVLEQGVALGWDDEQVLTWLNRQVDPAAAGLDVPLGVFGYRVDVRRAGEAAWRQLCLVEEDVSIGGIDLGHHSGEAMVEAHPAQLDGDTTGDYWLPHYFARWLGPSLVGIDALRAQLAGPASAGPARGVDPGMPLRYGSTYEFRVRLVDHTLGGPAPADEPTVPGPAPTGHVDVRRWVAPRQLRAELVPPDGQPPEGLTLQRPTLGYPGAVLTGLADATTRLLADLPAAQAVPREPTIPDPDVTHAAIVVQARALAFDAGAPDGPDVEDGWQVLYQTTRAFGDDLDASLALALDWRDVHDAATLAADPAAAPDVDAALPLPTARAVRLLISPLCRADPAVAYFGAEDVRSGRPVRVSMRHASGDERALIRPEAPGVRLRGVFLQPDPPSDPVSTLARRRLALPDAAAGDIVQRLAQAIELDAAGEGMTLRARPGRRLLLGCAPALRHLIGPDGASVTFGSASDLVRHWIVAVRLTLDRDWTWDALAPDGLAVRRVRHDPAQPDSVLETVAAGNVLPLRGVAAEALAGETDRTSTDVVFLDAIDPKPAAGAFPEELLYTYEVVPSLLDAPATDGPLTTAPLRLPITTPPRQTPAVRSAGIALSPYRHSEGYTSTEPRERALWLELDRAPDDPGDGVFARVLRRVADPLLSDHGDPDADLLDPPLPLDPELVRTIVPGQGDDRAGLEAMQPLLPSESSLHWLLPLPPGLGPDSRELLDLFTYELRFGHAQRWSTAQGRFGAPLRVTGVQHPPPSLVCTIGRTASTLTCSAPYATPCDERGTARRSLGTQLWMLVYAQVRRLDDESLNVLLDRRIAAADTRERLGGGAPDLYGTAAWTQNELNWTLEQLGLAHDAPLSCLAVETLPGDEPKADPLGTDLGYERLLRVSTLVAAPDVCC
jgi:hypothetical protein